MTELAHPSRLILSSLHRLVLLRIFRFVGNIRSNDADEQTFDITLPRIYGQSHLSEYCSPLYFDLHSAAALACTCQSLSRAWRDMQITDLCDQFQAAMRGLEIRITLQKAERHIRIDGSCRVHLQPSAAGCLVVKPDGCVDLSATMASLPPSTDALVVPKRPRGWTDEDCLFVALGFGTEPFEIQCGWLVFNALVGKFKSVDAAKRALDCFEYSHYLFPELAHPSERPTARPDLLVEVRCCLVAFGEQAYRECPFVWLRKQLGAGITPTLPRALFDASMLERSLYDIVRAESDVPFVGSAVHTAMSGWRSFLVWLTLRTLGMQISARSRIYSRECMQPVLPSDAPQLASMLTSCCHDALFGTGTSRYYHSRQLKLSRFGIVSASDVIVQSFLTDGARILSLLKSPSCTLGAALRPYLATMRPSADWLRHATQQQFYEASVLSETKLLGPATFTCVRARSRETVCTHTPRGRVLARLWRAAQGAPSDPRQCARFCPMTVLGAPRVQPSVAFIRPPPSLSVADRQLPRIMLSSEVSLPPPDHNFVHSLTCAFRPAPELPFVPLLSFRPRLDLLAPCQPCETYELEWTSASLQPTRSLVSHGRPLTANLLTYICRTWSHAVPPGGYLSDLDHINLLVELSTDFRQQTQPAFKMSDMRGLFETAQYHMNAVLGALDDAETFEQCFCLERWHPDGHATNGASFCTQEQMTDVVCRARLHGVECADPRKRAKRS